MAKSEHKKFAATVKRHTQEYDRGKPPTRVERGRVSERRKHIAYLLKRARNRIRSSGYPKTRMANGHSVWEVAVTKECGNVHCRHLEDKCFFVWFELHTGGQLDMVIGTTEDAIRTKVKVAKVPVHHLDALEWGADRLNKALDAYVNSGRR